MLVAREIIQGMAATFLGENGNRQDPLANPLHGDLRGLPPVYIQVGGYEALLDDSQAWPRRCGKPDGDVKLDVFPEMQHVFQFLAGVAPEADDAIRQAAPGCVRSWGWRTDYQTRALRHESAARRSGIRGKSARSKIAHADCGSSVARQRPD